MNRLKRWSLAVVTRFDELLVPFENHEALARGALRDMRKSLARASGQLARVKRDCDTLSREAAASVEVRDRWRERARSETDEEQALECLRRSRRAERERVLLVERLGAQRQMMANVEGTVRALEDRYGELQRQRSLLSTRQAASDAVESVAREGGGVGDVEDVFERWEVQLTESEYAPGEAVWQDVDHLEEDYVRAEEDASLLAELTEMRAEGGGA